MTKIYTILFGLLIQTLNLFSQEENWDVYLAQYQKGVGSTLINMSLKGSAPMKEFIYLLKIGVNVIDCTSEGLPSKGEFKMLYKISDKIKFIVDSISKNKAAGTFSYQCERTDYYYLTDTTGMLEFIESAFFANFPGYKHTITIRKDQNWEAYLTFLYPNLESYEYMTNEKVVLNLTKEGDDLTMPRQVDHWVYFKTEVDRNAFISFALNEKFKVESKNFLKDGHLKYQLQISRTDNVDMKSITAITMQLRKKAKELNGEYDGWETFVMKGK